MLLLVLTATIRCATLSSKEVKALNSLKDKRSTKGLTQAQLAQILGVSRAFYGLIEKGKRQPTYGLAVKIATFFNTKPEDIFFNLDGFRTKQKKKGA